ncbi:MAG: ABC transporter ATP-binding protein [Chloroflexota bacterium]|nr:ABC transporter ATP-binding protein/permease [Dehalococcoidia bacterium]MDW8253508.1 ABC transporter ATP-binding protein [Chloroflexota bacterium]
MHIDPALLRLAEGVRLRIVATMLLGLLGTIAAIASLALLGQAIGVLFAGSGLAAAMPFVFAAAVVVVARGGLLAGKEILAASIAGRVKVRLRTRLYRHLVTLGPGYLERRQTGDLLSRAVDGVEALEVYYGKYLPQLVVTVLAPLGIMAFLFTLHPMLPLILAACIVLALVAPAAFMKLTGRLGGLFWMRFGMLSSLMVDSLQGLPTLKAFARSKDRGREIRAAADAVAKSLGGLLAVNFGVAGVMDLVVTGGATAAVVFSAWATANGALGPGALVIVLLLSNEAFRPIRELAGLFHQGQTGVAAARGIFAILNEQPEVTPPAAPRSLPARQPAITFERVSFAYDRGARPALVDVSFRVEPGETVALVGPSGAGKTTALHLLMRFFDPTSGRVLLDGVDLRELALDDLRARFAYVGQDTYLFHGTVADNLRLAKPEATMEELRAVAEAANALDFIERLPHGFETVVGERGMRLSGGERQRIAIARALLKDAPILLLDEPTSSVDAENEESIQQALRRLAEGRTTIVIAHRLSTVADADRILVLEQGRLVEEGRHADLLAAGGVYARLVAAGQLAAPQEVGGGVR